MRFHERRQEDVWYIGDRKLDFTKESSLTLLGNAQNIAEVVLMLPSEYLRRQEAPVRN